MDIVRENRKGLNSSFFMKCKICNFEYNLKLYDENSESMDMNTASTFGSISTGIGFSTTEEYMSALNVPFMCPNKYQQCHENLGEIIRQTAWTKMEEAAEEEASLAREYKEVDRDNRPCITVVADGAWSKRSYNVNYNSASGVVSLLTSVLPFLM